MSTALTVVTSNPQPVSVAERVRQLQAEAKALASQHVDEMMNLMLQLQQCAESVNAGGEAYKAGIRNVARQIADDMDSKRHTIEAIKQRAE